MKKERPGHEDKTRRKLNQHYEIDKDLDSPAPGRFRVRRPLQQPEGHAEVRQVRIELVTFGLK